MIRDALARNDRPDILVERVDGEWTATSTERLRERIENVALGLRARGLRPGDRVALISQNRVDWLVADLGILFAGCVVVPIFPTQARDQVRFILEQSEAQLVFVDTPSRAKTLRERVGSAVPAVVFDDPGEDGLAALEARGVAERAAGPYPLSDEESGIRPHDLAILIYTSGTTGEPKGVMLSHRNLVKTSTNAFDYAFPSLTGEERVLTVLPFSHIFEHHVLYGFLLRGVATYICRDAGTLLADLRDVRPVVMTAVPRIFEHLLAGIIGRAKTQGRLRGRLVAWALAAGREHMRAVHGSGRVTLRSRLAYAVARALVLRKLRPALGLDALEFVVSGSAALHIDVALTFAGAGILILEGYGMTECSPTLSVNRVRDNRFGTVGKPIPEVEVRLADDGELLARGPGVMLGYYKDADGDREAFEAGWYRTGDVAEIDPQGYIRIVDRKKELLKTSSGKFLAPARIEMALKRSPFVGQVALVAEGRSSPSVLLAPNWALVRTELGIGAEVPTEEIAARPEVRVLMRRELAAYSKDLAPYEQVHRFALLPRDLTIEDGELSPTLKVRRRVVEHRFAPLIEAAYGTSA